nr:hypothetical protein [Tanacetum cinerariifolium]
MEAHLALTQPTHVNKVTSSCEICSGPHDTQYCMENPEQAFVDYASLRTNEAGITSSCEICSGPHDTQYCMENPEQAFVDYASLRTNEAGSRQIAINQGPKSFNEAANAWKGKPNLTGHTPKHLPAHRTGHSPPTRLITKRSLRRH